MGDHGAQEPDALLAVDTRVGDFRIRGLLGEGAMGQVYLAQDTTLGRRVALKLIKRSVMQGDGLARFLEEARATASFNHPHIVTLHAVGEHEGRPFLALEYVDGESLRARIATGPLPVQEALRYCHAIAEAIAEAHRRGLVHADLKPENIVIPRDGRVRVVDFGLAKLVDGAANSASGTPAYMAPERWRGQPTTGAIDIWALGVTLHELITGSRPISDGELAKIAFSTGPLPIPELPATSWAALVRECLAGDPALRPTADELVRRLSVLLDPRAAAGDDHARSPFPGLAAFTRENAEDYFGRAAEVDALVEQLRSRPLIPVVGPSGIGKSSFVRAAIVPRLEETHDWRVLALRPGSSPFDNLATALAITDKPPSEVAEALRRHPDALSLLLDDLAKHQGARILLFIDQFEETFTLARGEAVAFCEALGRAALAGEPWRILLTLRDDFLGRLAESAAIRPHLGAVMPLAALSAADLRAAILGPLANAGYETDVPELAGRIVEDIEGQPACLPLLQFTCQSLWERRDVSSRRILTREYEAMGGATGALATHAQRLLGELTADQVRLARSILLALVNPDGTRRPRLRGELVEDLPPGADAVIERLLDRRLIVATRDTDHDAAKLEVAHEALATAWPQLARWLDETYEQRLLVVELEQASLLWQRRGKRDDETWGGAALGEAVRKVDEWNITLPSVSRAFLDACVDRERRIRRKRRVLLSGTIAILGAATIVAVLAAVAYWRKEQEAIAQQEQIRLAAADMGIFELHLERFDWDPIAQETRPTVEQSELSWRLRAVDESDPRSPGRFYTGDDIRRGTAEWRGKTLIETVQARSGPAFLEVERAGCGTSLLYLRRVPGYTERATPPKQLSIKIPSCQASRVDMMAIPAGAFFRSVRRDDASEPHDELADIAAFRMDRTEVTRAAFSVYESLGHLTGDVAAPSEYLDLDRPGGERLPIVGVNFFTAQNYCQYLGKSLPTIDEWQKAFRGGVVLDGEDNPAPRRLTPWITATSNHPANVLAPNRKGEPAAVGSFVDDTSPYQVVDLAGNVAEWSVSPSPFKLRTVLGGSWSIPIDQQSDRITWRNSRADMANPYDIGIRCVAR